jgi:membrane protein implicated in regulation of membrane protease activity
MNVITDFLFAASGWMIIAIILIGFEFMVPGIYFMWVGFAALLLSGITFFFPDISLAFQLLLFSVFAVGLVYAGKKYLMEKTDRSDDSTLNLRGRQYIGRTYEVAVAFKNGKGKIKVEDTLWTAIGPKSLAVGESVKVVDIDGTRLMVEAVK